MVGNYSFFHGLSIHPSIHPSIHSSIPHPFIYHLSIYLSIYHLSIYLSIYLSIIYLSSIYLSSIYLSIYHLSIIYLYLSSITCLSVYLSSHHFCRLIIMLRPPIKMLPGVSPLHSPVYGHHKMSVDSPMADFPGSFSTVWRIRKKNLSAGEIKPFFFRGEKWSSRLSTLKCYSGFQMNEKLVCIVMRLGRDLEGL